MTGVEKVEEFIELRLRWFEHIERMDDEKAPVKAKNYVLDGLKRVKPEKRWKEAI